MDLFYKIAILGLRLLTPCMAQAQVPDTISHHSEQHSDVLNKERDLIDIALHLMKKSTDHRSDTASQRHDLQLSALPAAGYTLQTGFAVIAAANAAFYTADHTTQNISTIATNITYTQYKQTIFPIQANIWTNNNKYNFTTDWRYMKFPSYTYGLGGYTNLNEVYSIDYSYIRLHQALMRSLGHDFYVGLGYEFDYFWNIHEIDPPAGKITDFQQYGFGNQETAAGITLNALYDDRRNSINPDNGYYAKISYRYNDNIVGSNSNWQSIVTDLRRYVVFPYGTKNVFALWNYDWLTLGGTPPYLLLPNTGGDAYTNTGRGYIQGRFRGKNMIYLEGEYRINITNNELLGGVLFANAQSFTELKSNRFETIAPAVGAGIRLKLNKFSKTNVCIDYGVGFDGSKGFFVNLGEVF
ncbi:MAG: hypothetical protein WCG87_05915 [Bacteroidota bacterium]